MTSLHPTPTRIALLDDVRLGQVFRDAIGDHYISGDRKVTAAIREMHAAGWVELAAEPGDYWQLTDAGREVLDAEATRYRVEFARPGRCRVMAAALVLAVLVAVAFIRAYWVADRQVQRRDEQIRHRDKRIRELRDELALTQEACDRQTVKARHMFHQANGYRAEVTRLSARNAELRDLVDAGNGSEPTLTEEFLTWLAEEPITYPEDPR